MSDQRRNAEHYMDMTAYLAIQNAERELGMLPKKGEIWKVDYNGAERTVVVVAAHDEYCTALLLNEQRRSKSDVAVDVAGVGVMYTTPGMLAYRYNSIFTERVAEMTENDFSDLLCFVADDLCIKSDEQTDELLAYKEKVASLEELILQYQEKVEQQQDEINQLEAKIEVSFDEKSVALAAERDVYKTLYTETLAKLIDRRCS